MGHRILGLEFGVEGWGWKHVAFLQRASLRFRRALAQGSFAMNEWDSWALSRGSCGVDKALLRLLGLFYG